MIMYDETAFSKGPAGSGPKDLPVRCPDCGWVAVRATDATVFGDIDSGAHHLSFVCPGCELRTTEAVEVGEVARLVLAGAALRALTRPAEADETSEAPPLDEDDVAAFVESMDQPGWEYELLA